LSRKGRRDDDATSTLHGWRKKKREKERCSTRTERKGRRERPGAKRPALLPITSTGKEKKRGMRGTDPGVHPLVFNLVGKCASKNGTREGANAFCPSRAKKEGRGRGLLLKGGRVSGGGGGEPPLLYGKGKRGRTFHHIREGGGTAVQRGKVPHTTHNPTEKKGGGGVEACPIILTKEEKKDTGSVSWQRKERGGEATCSRLWNRGKSTSRSGRMRDVTGQPGLPLQGKKGMKGDQSFLFYQGGVRKPDFSGEGGGPRVDGRRLITHLLQKKGGRELNPEKRKEQCHIKAVGLRLISGPGKRRRGEGQPVPFLRENVSSGKRGGAVPWLEYFSPRLCRQEGGRRSFSSVHGRGSPA